MLLYHGSNVPVRVPKLLKTQRRVDFGNGFYTTTDFEQAKKWAVRTAQRLKSSEAFVTVYEITEEDLLRLRILEFENPDENWLKFICDMRRSNPADDRHDLIIGPVANDRTMPVIDLFLDGFLDEGEAIKRLLPQKLKDQVVFKTEKALKLLKTKEVISL